MPLREACLNCGERNLREVTDDHEGNEIRVGFDCLSCGHGQVALFEFVDLEDA